MLKVIGSLKHKIGNKQLFEMQEICEDKNKGKRKSNDVIDDGCGTNYSKHVIHIHNTFH
jgi:hypothetical protein